MLTHWLRFRPELHSLETRLAPAAGALDPTFNGDGKVTLDFAQDNDGAGAVMITGAGKTVVAGESTAKDGNRYITLVMYDDQGNLDSSFDGDGILITNIKGAALAAARSKDDKILIAGFNDGSVTGTTDIQILKFDLTGKLDSKFGTNGVTTTDINLASDSANDIAVADDGRIVLAGVSRPIFDSDQSFVAVYSADGQLDTSFNKVGYTRYKLELESRNEGVALDGNQHIVAAGRAVSGDHYTDFAVSRFNFDGTPDTTFNGTGHAVLGLGFGAVNLSGYAVGVMNNNDVVIGGEINLDFGVVRVTNLGKLDTSFDGDGYARTPIGNEQDRPYALEVQPDQKIVLAGFVRNVVNKAAQYDFGLARYLPNGSLDASFGTNGVVTTDFAGPDTTAYAATLAPGNRIVAVGSSALNNKAVNSDFAVARYDLTSSNNAPVVSNANVGLINTINEDAGPNAGGLVRDAIPGGTIHDNDPDALTGIAITAAETNDGTWQFSLNGSAWSDLGAVSNANARLLAGNASTRLRFVPDADWNGEAKLTYRAWDRTAGTNGAMSDTTSNGGATAFSTGTAQLKVVVNPVNDAPAVHMPDEADIFRNSGVTFTAANTIALTDIDAGSARFRVTLNASVGKLTISSATGLMSVVGAGSSVLRLEGTVANVAAALKRVTYTAPAGFTGLARIAVNADDLGGTGLGGPLGASDTINVNVGNRAPQIRSPIGTLANYSMPANTFLQTNATTGVLRAFVDPDGDTLQAQLVAWPSAGWLTLRRDGGFTFRPPTGFHGHITFTVRAYDGLRFSDPLLIDINVI